MNEGLKHLTGLWRWIPKELTGCAIDLRQLDRAGEELQIKKESGWAKSKYQWKPDLEFQTRKRSSLAGEGDSPAPLLVIYIVENRVENYASKSSPKNDPKGPTFFLDPFKPCKWPFGLEKMASETLSWVDRRAANKRAKAGLKRKSPWTDGKTGDQRPE